MNLEDLLTKLQAERKTWQDRASEQIDKAYQSDLVDKHHFNLQSSYDQGVAWGLYLASTLILQDQLEHQNTPPCAANDVLRHPVESLGSKPAS